MCSEKIKQIKLPRRSSGIGARPGYSTSSENIDELEEEGKSSDGEAYMESS